MKRFVILRDENQLLAELSREPDRLIEPVVPVEPPAPPAAVAEMAARPPAPVTAPAPAANGSSANAGGKAAKLPDLARAAALSAEREAIQSALDHFRWNRRKAAAQLGVSYKTLLNKMKECGITTPVEDGDGR
jgi:DNA-binding NtrC family response regulator